MIVGANTLRLNEATMKIAVQEWLNRETTHPPIVANITYLTGGTFEVLLHEPKEGKLK